MKIDKKSLFRIMAFLLILVQVVPLTARAATSEPLRPQASDYIGSYQAYICSVGDGKMQVWFNVVGAGTQDELGALRISIYESSDEKTWTWKESYLYNECDDMLAYNVGWHMSHVEYAGTVGMYYKAYVCIWGGSDGDGDTRYIWTAPQQATEE